MKTIYYILLILSFLFSSCNKQKDDKAVDDADSDIRFSTNIVFSFPQSDISSSNSRISSLRINSKSPTPANGKEIRLSLWNLPNTPENLKSFRDACDSPDRWKEIFFSESYTKLTTSDGRLSVENLKLGYTSFVASYIQSMNGKDYNMNDMQQGQWNIVDVIWAGEIATYKDRPLSQWKLYKRFVGVTRGASSKNNVDDIIKDLKMDDPSNFFTPKFNSESKLFGASSLANPVDIKASDLTYNADKLSYNKTVVVEMTPINSVLDIILKNESANYYLGVWSADKLFYVMPSGADGQALRAVLNLSSIVAGSKLTCKLIAFTPKPGSDFKNDGNNFDCTEAELSSKLNIINNNGNGIDLMKDLTVVGNQRYYVRKSASDNSQRIITLTDDDIEFKGLTDANILVLYHTEMNNNYLHFDNWK